LACINWYVLARCRGVCQKTHNRSVKLVVAWSLPQGFGRDRVDLQIAKQATKLIACRTGPYNSFRSAAAHHLSSSQKNVASTFVAVAAFSAVPVSPHVTERGAWQPCHWSYLASPERRRTESPPLTRVSREMQVI